MKKLRWITPALLSGVVCFTSLYAWTGNGEARDNSELDQIVVPDPVVTDIVLPAKTESGKSISWTSDREDILASSGLVNLPRQTTEVRLTATAEGVSRTI